MWLGATSKNYFTDVTIINKAKAGRSTKSFIDEGRFEEIKGMIVTGDYLLIQFGHNDQKLEDPSRGTLPFGEYQANLRMFITVARDRGANPILLNPVSRRRFDANNRIEQSFGEYPAAMQQVAEQMNVPIIDLRAKSASYYEYIGSKESTRLFAWTNWSTQRLRNRIILTSAPTVQQKLLS